jgi:hypothetical protein
MGLAFTAFWLGCAGSRKKTSKKLCGSGAFSIVQKKNGKLNTYSVIKAD